MNRKIQNVLACAAGGCNLYPDYMIHIVGAKEYALAACGAASGLSSAKPSLSRGGGRMRAGRAFSPQTLAAHGRAVHRRRFSVFQVQCSALFITPIVSRRLTRARRHRPGLENSIFHAPQCIPMHSNALLLGERSGERCVPATRACLLGPGFRRERRPYPPQGMGRSRNFHFRSLLVIAGHRRSSLRQALIRYNYPGLERMLIPETGVARVFGALVFVYPVFGFMPGVSWCLPAIQPQPCRLRWSAPGLAEFSCVSRAGLSTCCRSRYKRGVLNFPICFG